MKTKFFVLFLLGLALTRCSSLSGGSGAGDKKLFSPVYYGVAVIQPAKGEKAAGVLKFSESFGTVKVEGQFEGLDKNSKHAIHIHEFGDCTAADFVSAGGHYNPAGHAHGAPDGEVRHIGDLGNLETNGKGQARLKMTVSEMSINGSINPVLGRSVVVHKNHDDFLSQPAGGAGPRIACGVIGASAK
jgi:Cu-Zn family superoxide dismutase